MTGIDRAMLGGARDAAFILAGYAGALRIGELAALALEDLASRPDGIVLRIRRSKTDRNVAGARSPSRAASTPIPTRSAGDVDSRS